MPDRDKAQGLKKDVHFRWLPLSQRRRVTGPKSPNPIVERLSSARDTFPDACSSLVSISLDDSRALRREYAATNPQFRYISIRLRGSSTIGSLCAALEYLSLATRKGEKEMHSYILYSRFWLILVRDTAWSVRWRIVRVFRVKREITSFRRRGNVSENSTNSRATEKGKRGRAEQSRVRGYFGRRSIGRGRSPVRAMWPVKDQSA